MKFTYQLLLPQYWMRRVSTIQGFGFWNFVSNYQRVRGSVSGYQKSARQNFSMHPSITKKKFSLTKFLRIRVHCSALFELTTKFLLEWINLNLHSMIPSTIWSKTIQLWQGMLLCVVQNVTDVASCSSFLVYKSYTFHRDVNNAFNVSSHGRYI